MTRHLQQLMRIPSGAIGALILGAILFMALFAGWLYPGDPWAMVAEPNLRPFSSGYLFGTDMLGRDIAAGVAHGARVSLSIGVISTLIAVLLGTSLGAMAGYFGGKLDDLIMRLTEIFQTIPGFLLALLMVAIIGPSMQSIVAAIGAISWPSVSRLSRAEFLSMKQRDFVKAAQVGGQSSFRIMLCQILPNTLSPLIVAASLMVATAILLESAISFLGLGDRTYISWGFMIGSGRTTLLQTWWLSAIPGLAIFLTVLALNFIGDALNQVLNPRRSPSYGGSQ